MPGGGPSETGKGKLDFEGLQPKKRFGGGQGIKKMGGGGGGGLVWRVNVE